MNKYEAVGVLKTLIDNEASNYIKEALELSIKYLQASDSTQHTHYEICQQCQSVFTDVYRGPDFGYKCDL